MYCTATKIAYGRRAHLFGIHEKKFGFTLRNFDVMKLKPGYDVTKQLHMDVELNATVRKPV